MCDTMVSTPETSADGAMILAKNSDREPNEAQNITFVPAADHPAGSRVRCTYIEVPQVQRTFAVLLSRPFWMYGAEMGVNEHGVAIGNEAVFTKEKYHKKNDALLGMDILRLALERSRTAMEAIDWVIRLLNEHGQGGVHTMGGIKYYHNSLLIADPREAYIFETAGVHWACRRVDGIASISNCLTIGEEYAASSDDPPGEDKLPKDNKRHRVNFTETYSDTVYTHFARGRIRMSCSAALLARKKGAVTSAEIMSILRNHNAPEPYRPGSRPMERICLHAGGLISSQTAGSMVAVLKKGRMPLVYFTGTAAPCTGIYKPHVLASGQKRYASRNAVPSSPFGGADLYGTATGRFDRDTLWWTGELIHRRVLMNYPRLMPFVRAARDEIESAMVTAVEKKWRTGAAADIAALCARRAQEMTSLNEEIADVIQHEYRLMSGAGGVPWWFAKQWNRINAKAGIML
ncbi:MAG: C69 family dipeptidase [Spirochaetes bacterium]|nr:C69 family dipeptidase [Spirochaetota bacterium]